MSGLPHGTVTFLLTDVAGSTALWEQAPEAMRDALERHDFLITALVHQHGGLTIKARGEGDSHFAVFEVPSEAVAAACAIQRALFAEAWPAPAPLRVRVAIHTGEAMHRDGDYYGAAVNRCARLRGLAQGGQILLSEATATLVRDHLPPGTTLRDHGPQRLRGLARPERVYELVVDGASTAFPRLSADAGHRRQLPTQTTRFIGRGAELERVRKAVLRDEIRLVTVTGPGGAGKTRLAVEAAAEVADQFAHGVCFVDLAPVTDPERLVPVIARAVGVAERQTPLFDDLCAHLQEWPLLLLLDNFEQLLDAAPVVAALLAACADLTVLVTSRAPLELRGEHEIEAPPLAAPDPAQTTSLDALEQCDSVALFLDRAVSVQASFRLTSENAHAIATICAHLDGLPLALELAAARIRILPPEALAARLGQTLPLLTGGPRDLPVRQRTLRDAIAWSYDLLDEREQRAFRALSVFVGGFQLDAAEAVLADRDGAPSGDALDLVSQLVARSLVRRTGAYLGEPRFGLLETIRAYSLERLADAGEEVTFRDRHLAWCLRLAEASSYRLGGAAAITALDRTEAEFDNMRAALRWSLSDPRLAETAGRLAYALSIRLWTLRGYLIEGSAWLERALMGAEAGSELRGHLLERLGYLRLRQNEYAAACVAFAEALDIWSARGDIRQRAITLQHYGLCQYHAGQRTEGRASLDEGLRLARHVGERQAERVSLRNLADIHIDTGDYIRASRLYEESLALARSECDDHDIAYALRGIGHIARVQGQYARAAACLRESVALLRPLGDRRCLPLSLEGLACITVGAGWAERAVRIFGAVHAMQERTGAPSPPASLPDYERTLADARSALGTERFMVCWAEGAGMELDAVVTLALSAPIPADARVAVSASSTPAVPKPASAPSAAASGAVPLSAREREVVALIAAGQSNREIAERLTVSVRTVERHIENVYGRLGISGKAGRAIVTAYALRHHLADPYETDDGMTAR